MIKTIKTLYKKMKRLINGVEEPEPITLMRHVTEPELHEIVAIGKPINLSMELLVEYLELREEGLEPEEAKQTALREWDL